MPTTMTFSKVQAYLDAIADKNIAENNGDVANSPHGRFWKVKYKEFTSQNVPGGARVECNGKPTPIIDQQNPGQSAFYIILTNTAGYCGNPQMPEGGPWITDDGYEVNVDGSPVKGSKIQADLLEWLTNSYPE